MRDLAQKGGKRSAAHAAEQRIVQGDNKSTKKVIHSELNWMVWSGEGSGVEFVLIRAEVEFSSVEFSSIQFNPVGLS